MKQSQRLICVCLCPLDRENSVIGCPYVEYVVIPTATICSASLQHYSQLSVLTDMNMYILNTQ